MIREQLLSKLRAHKGEIFIDVSNHNDCFWFKGVKSDIIAMVTQKFEPGSETGFELDDEGGFGKDYTVS